MGKCGQAALSRGFAVREALRRAAAHPHSLNTRDGDDLDRLK